MVQDDPIKSPVVLIYHSKFHLTWCVIEIPLSLRNSMEMCLSQDSLISQLSIRSLLFIHVIRWILRLYFHRLSLSGYVKHESTRIENNLQKYIDHKISPSIVRYIKSMKYNSIKHGTTRWRNEQSKNFKTKREIC